MLTAAQNCNESQRFDEKAQTSPEPSTPSASRASPTSIMAQSENSPPKIWPLSRENLYMHNFVHTFGHHVVSIQGLDPLRSYASTELEWSSYSSAEFD